MIYFKKIAVRNVSKCLNLSMDIIEPLMVSQLEPSYGEYSLPCFKLSKIVKISPVELAEHVKKTMDKEGFQRIENNGPYVNFFIDRKEFQKKVTEKILREKDTYGATSKGMGKTVIINGFSFYSSEQTYVKELCREAVCTALNNILSFSGYDSLIYKAHAEKNGTDYLKNGISFIEELENKGLLSEVNGVEAVDLREYNLPPCIIKNTQEEASTEAKYLQDAVYKKSKYKYFKNIYIESTDQQLKLKLITSTLKRLGYPWHEDCIHVIFESLGVPCYAAINELTKGVISEQLIHEIKRSCHGIFKEDDNNSDEQKHRLYWIIEGTVRFYILHNFKRGARTLKWEELFNPNGETSVFICLVYAKGEEILKRNEKQAAKIHGFNEEASNGEEVSNEVCYQLAKHLGQFENTIIHSSEKLEIKILSEYLITLCNIFNNYLDTMKSDLNKSCIIESESINIVKASCSIIKDSMNLLGIELVENLNEIIV